MVLGLLCLEAEMCSMVQDPEVNNRAELYHGRSSHPGGNRVSVCVVDRGGGGCRGERVCSKKNL